MKKEINTMAKPNIPANLLKAIPILLILLILFNTFYIVNEGHVGVVKRFGQAIPKAIEF